MTLAVFRGQGTILDLRGGLPGDDPRLTRCRAKVSRECARQSVVEAAANLFRAEGIRAVSMDAFAAKADLTKRTLYYHFRSKDDLIAACMEERDQPNLTLFKQWYPEAEGDLSDNVR